MTRTVRECVRCEKSKPHYARHLCGACYQKMAKIGRIDDYPLVKDHRLESDDVMVDRGVAWLIAHHAIPYLERGPNLASRPRLSRGEKILILARTRHSVPAWIATESLGISGASAPNYLHAAGRLSDPTDSWKVAA